MCVCLQAQVTVSFEVTVSSAQLLLIDREHETVANTIRFALMIPHAHVCIFPCFVLLCFHAPVLSFPCTHSHSFCHILIVQRSPSHSPIFLYSHVSIHSYTHTRSLEYPNSSTSILDADQHSKVVMKFTLLNKETKKSVQVHQVSIFLISLSLSPSLC